MTGIVYIFLRTPTPIIIVAGRIYIPTNSVRGFSFLHTFSSILNLSLKISNGGKVFPLCSDQVVVRQRRYSLGGFVSCEEWTGRISTPDNTPRAGVTAHRVAVSSCQRTLGKSRGVISCSPAFPSLLFLPHSLLVEKDQFVLHGTVSSCLCWALLLSVGLPRCSVVKNLPARPGDVGSVPGWGRYSGGGNGNPLQYSYLWNPMDGGAWQAPVHGVTRVRHNWTTEHTLLSVILSCFASPWSGGSLPVCAPHALILQLPSTLFPSHFLLGNEHNIQGACHQAFSKHRETNWRW